MYAWTDLLAILFLGGVFYALGFRIVRRTVSDNLEIEESVKQAEHEISGLERRHILLKALNESPYTEILSPRQRARLRHSLLHPGDSWVEPVPFEEAESPVTSESEPTVQPTGAFVPPTQRESVFEMPVDPVPAMATEIAPPAVTVPSQSERGSSPPSSSPLRKPVLETIRASWDPAVMLLYVGALLVVVAGLIFATYNWGSLGAWQKLGMLAAGTAAFLIAGFAIRNIERVQPASTTFMVIGGLLVPANFLAAYTVFDDVQPAIPLLLGAIATTVIHALLSFQPGASLFRYSAVGAATVAIVSIPAAFGLPAGWGGVLGLVVIALLPDHVFGSSRFRKAWHLVSRSGAGLLAGFAIWQGWGAHGWMVVGALIGVSMVATRFSYRHPTARVYLLVFADLALIAASVQIAHNFDGDRWMIAAGLLALTLVLIQESRRFLIHSRWIEFAAAISVAMLTAESARVLGTDPWAVSVGAAVLTGMMVLHARRHERLARLTEAIAVIALPISPGAAVYAIDPSLWSLVVSLAALAVTTVWLGLRHAYAQNWPGLVATSSSLGAMVALVPAIGPDVGWGCVAALFVIALMPYPFGKLVSFRPSWVGVANVLAVPLTFVALWRGFESTDWLIPLTLVAISMWMTRLALEAVLDPVVGHIAADVAAVLTGVSVAWVLRDEQWMLAAGLLGVTLVLLKRSFTWPSLQSRVQFAAAFTLAAFAGEVTRELVDSDWVFAVGASVLTIGMLLHARLHPRHSHVSDFFAAWSFPLAIASGTGAYHDSWWWLPIGAGVLTLTLVLHRSRYRVPGDLNLAIASISGIFAVLIAADLLGVIDSSRSLTWLLMALGIVLTTIANGILPRIASVSGWLKNLIRMEALLIFFAAGLVSAADNAAVLSMVILAMFWHIWASRVSIWSLPMAGAIFVAFSEVLAPADTGPDAGLWWYLAVASVYAAIAWQLDRRTTRSSERVHAGAYLWVLVTLVSAILILATYVMALDHDESIHNGLVLIAAAGLHWVGYRSTGGRVLLIPAGVLSLAGLAAFTSDEVTHGQHLILTVIVFAVASVLYWWTSTIRTWLASILAAFGLMYLLLATDLTYSRDLLPGLLIAWILVSLGIVRWRSAATSWQTKPVFYQAMMLHGFALVLPLLDHSAHQITRPDVVLVLVSLAGLVSTFGSLQRSRGLVLIGSAIGMSALMLQVNIGSPANLHAYTVPLSIYLLAVGLLLRRDARIANTLLAVGSAILVIPAMIEALTTGEIVWLWIALAEALGLFLFGTVLRLRIPTAAGVIAVSVIVLRMLVFAVSVLASWVSILAAGVTLLITGTAWLIFREKIHAKAKVLFSRWQALD